MFATEFNDLLDEEHKSINLTPENLINTIDELNGWIYVSFRVCNTDYYRRDLQVPRMTLIMACSEYCRMPCTCTRVRLTYNIAANAEWQSMRA